MPNPAIIKQLYESRINQYAAFVGFFHSRGGIKALLERSGLLQPRMKVLDAGCGFGMATFALLDALDARNMPPVHVDAFDLTPAMLQRFRSELDTRKLSLIRLQEADILDDNALPENWTSYDFVVSTSMLEYLPRDQLPHALSTLRMRMKPGSRMLVVITRKSLVTKVLIEWAWKAERYTADELRAAFSQAGFDQLEFIRFPLRYGWLNQSNHVVVAQRSE